jgi:hypothetical protein
VYQLRFYVRVATRLDMDFMLSQVTKNISFFFIEIEKNRGEGKMLKRHPHDTTFSEKFLVFTKF